MKGDIFMSVVELLRKLMEFIESMDKIPKIITAVLTVITAVGWIIILKTADMHWIKKVLCIIIIIPIWMIVFFCIGGFFVQMVYELIIALVQLIPFILVIILFIIIILIMG